MTILIDNNFVVLNRPLKVWWNTDFVVTQVVIQVVDEEDTDTFVIYCDRKGNVNPHRHTDRVVHTKTGH